MDTQREEFYGRIARLERDRPGPGPARRKPAGGAGSWMRPAVLVLAALFATKALVHARIGPESYDYRIALLAAGDGADRVGAWVLAADPVTLALSQGLRALAP